MSKPYYDQTLTKTQAQAVLRQSGAVHSPERSKPGIVVYKLGGGGEAMAEAASGGKVRLRLYRGKCAC